MSRFEGKVAVVTGAMQGIGEGISKVLARHDAHVVLTDISEKVSETADSIKEEGRSASSKIIFNEKGSPIFFRITSTPLTDFAPSAMDSAIFSVFPVLLSYMITNLVIFQFISIIPLIKYDSYSTTSNLKNFLATIL